MGNYALERIQEFLTLVEFQVFQTMQVDQMVMFDHTTYKPFIFSYNR
jgi:hypothetical protein